MHIEGVPESDVTRKHVLYDHARDGAPGLLSIIGGKLTAYRSIAENLVDTACRSIGVKAAGITANLPLPGGMVGSDFNRYRAVYTAGWVSRTGLDRMAINHLIDVYGARHAAVLALIEQDPTLGTRISEERPEVLAQVAYAVTQEGAQTLTDVMLRRLTVGLSAGRGRDAVDTVAPWLAEHLGWDAARARAERAAWEAEVALGDAPSLAPADTRPAVPTAF
jgi:glycerol-3-phosphate dehydrogenase